MTGAETIQQGSGLSPLSPVQVGRKTIQAVNYNLRMFTMWKVGRGRQGKTECGVWYTVSRMPVSTRHNNAEGCAKTVTGQRIFFPVHWINKGWKLLVCPPDLAPYQADKDVGRYLTPDPPPKDYLKVNEATAAEQKRIIAEGSAEGTMAQALKQLTELVGRGVPAKGGDVADAV